MTIAWILGWAVPEAWFAPQAVAALPNAGHVFIPPTARALARLHGAGPFDAVVGYSLGSLLLLSAATRIHVPGRIVLLAPIFGFASEDGLGGRSSRTQVRALARWVRREPAAALQDFYQRAGLDVPPALAPVADADDLAWGLDRLKNDRARPPLPAGWRAYCGAHDPLLDAAKLRALDERITTVAGASHHPVALINAAREAIG